MRSIVYPLILGAALAAPAMAQDRNELVRSDRAQFAETDRWIYDDLERGFTEARDARKPLMVVLRCVP